MKFSARFPQILDLDAALGRLGEVTSRLMPLQEEWFDAWRAYDEARQRVHPDVGPTASQIPGLDVDDWEADAIAADPSLRDPTLPAPNDDWKDADWARYDAHETPASVIKRRAKADKALKTILSDVVDSSIVEGFDGSPEDGPLSTRDLKRLTKEIAARRKAIDATEWPDPPTGGKP